MTFSNCEIHYCKFSLQKNNKSRYKKHRMINYCIQYFHGAHVTRTCKMYEKWFICKCIMTCYIMKIVIKLNKQADYMSVKKSILKHVEEKK